MDATTKAIAEALRLWHRHDKVVPIERGWDYRRQRLERAGKVVFPLIKPTPPVA